MVLGVLCEKHVLAWKNSPSCQNTRKKRIHTAPKPSDPFLREAISSDVVLTADCFENHHGLTPVPPVYVFQMLWHTLWQWGHMEHKEKQPVCLQLSKAISHAESLLILQDHFLQLIPPEVWNALAFTFPPSREDSINRSLCRFGAF